MIPSGQVISSRFASTEEGNHLTEDQQWRKLAFIKEIAEEIWK
ncbi:hypothetical protein ACFVQB_31755 [Paenibacillus sp. NPDC057886]